MSQNPDHLRALNTLHTADPRNRFGVQTDNGFRPKTLEDHHRQVAEITLNDQVPEKIVTQFETSKNIYLYAWFVYRFFPVVRLHACACLELALRDRFEEEMIAAGEKRRPFGPGLTRLLKHAQKEGHLKNECFSGWWHLARVRAQQRVAIETIREMDRLGLDQMPIDDDPPIKDEDCDHDYLTGVMESIAGIRNTYAHGSSSVDHMALGTLLEISEIINHIYSSD